MIRPLRVILPLYNEEIYFIVREDSPLNYVHEIRNAKINAGELGSGTALTTTTLYRLMFNAPHSRSERELPVQRGRAGQIDRPTSPSTPSPSSRGSPRSCWST